MVENASAKQDDIFENINLDLSNIRNRFENGTDKNGDCDNKKANEKITRSESIHKIMQKYQSRVSGDKDNASSSDDEDCKVESPVEKGEKVSFRGMSALKSQWESGTIRANSKSENSVEEELAELRQKGKPLKQAYERAVQEAKSVENLSAKNISDTFVVDSSIKAGTIKERFEKGPEIEEDRIERLRKEREEEIHRIAGSETCTKEARNKFRQIEANMGKDQPPNGLSNGANGTSVEDISISSNELQQRFKYFENLKDNQPNFAKEGGDETDGSGMGKVDDIPKVDTTKKMLDKFKALEANGQANGQMNGAGVGNVPKSPIRITPPRETKPVYENEPIAERDPNIVRSSYKSEDDIHVEPEKAKNLRAKFENWQTEIERENRKNNYEEEGEYVPHIDTTKNLRAMFESIKDEYKPNEKPRPRINRFVQENKPSNIESCYVCAARLYPMEKMEFSGIKIHKNCFRCNKCHAPLRLDNFTVRAEKLFCIPHFKQMFMEKGNYDEGFGMEQHKDKWSNKTATTTTNGKSNGIDDAKMNGNGSLETKTNGTNGNGHLEDHFDVHSTDDEEHHEEATSSLEPEEREQEEYSYERDQIAELDDQPLDGPIIAVD
ncbi:LIM domain and actin-binding protein 1 [Blomia tropicalis]|nr:LIM domain and actin-binding protein 1 [Blomia tropicalis]